MEVLIGKVLCAILATLASLLIYFGQRRAFGADFDGSDRFTKAFAVCWVRIFVATLPYFFLILFGHYVLHGVTRLSSATSFLDFMANLAVIALACFLASLLWSVACLFWAGVVMIYPLPLLLFGRRPYFVGLCLFIGVVTWFLGFYLYRPIGSPF